MAVFIGNNDALMSRNIYDLWTFQCSAYAARATSAVPTSLRCSPKRSSRPICKVAHPVFRGARSLLYSRWLAYIRGSHTPKIPMVGASVARNEILEALLGELTF